MIVLALLSACQQPVAEVQPHPADAIPQRLSDWSLFTHTGKTLRLNKNVLPYTLNTPLFTDYAQKLRTVWLPAGSHARYQSDSSFDFPVGTIISKTFYYPLASTDINSARTKVLKQAPGMPGFAGDTLDLSQLRLIETRLLIHQKTGWQALPYVWNSDQSEAFLALGGDWINLELISDETSSIKTSIKTSATAAAAAINRSAGVAFDYVVPDANQCAGCHATDHSNGEPRPIGPKARHLNRTFDYVQGRVNQLQYWQDSGRLSQVPAANTWPQTAAWRQPTANTLEQRARGYLDINCAHCHSPTGPADTSGLFLDWATQTPRQLGLCKPPVAAGRGSGGHAFAIVPGRADQSILTFRMTSTDPGQMMPELGRSLVHEEGVKLINDWINSLTGQCPPPLALSH